MSEYIHSGVAGKMNRIVKPHLGKVLVTDKFGNAKESEVDIEKLYTDLDEDNKIGNLSNLNTENKSNLVASINELKTSIENSSSQPKKYTKFLNDTWNGARLLTAQTYSINLPMETTHYESFLIEYLSNGVSLIGGLTFPSNQAGLIYLAFTAYNSTSESDVTYLAQWPILWSEDENLGIRAICEFDISSGLGKIYSLVNGDENVPNNVNYEEAHGYIPVREGYTFKELLFGPGSYIKSVTFTGPYGQTSSKYVGFNGDTLNFYRK